MATRPKAVIESRNGEKFSPITIAKNVLTDNGQNLHDILSDRKEDMMTPTIENSSSMFKVGQGDNVDYSSNIVSGAYEDMVLKGKTMVNCIQEPSSQDVVLPYEFAEGQYVTINDTKESGALGVKLKGQTLVNLSHTKDEVSSSVSVTTTIENITNVKPNTDYICFVNIKSSNPLSGITINQIFRVEKGAILGGVVGDIPTNYTTKYFIFNTGDRTSVNVVIRNAFTDASIGLTANTVHVKDVMILEYQKGMENWDIPYFEGMASCKMPILRTVGKNIFDGELELGAIDSNTTGENVVNNSWKRTVNYLKVEPNTKYVYSLSLSGAVLGIRFYDENKKFIRDGGTKSNFTTPTNCRYIRFNVTTTEEVNIQIEKGSSATSYEPYKSSSLSLPEEVMLRGIPNSNVHDTLNLQTGEYTQNVFEYTLNGSEAYSNLTTNTWTDEYMAFLVNLEASPFNFPHYPNNALASSTAYVEGFNYDSGVTQAVNREGWYLGNGASPNYLGFRIKRSRLTEYNDSPREWIRANNIRILLNIHPVTTKINLPSTLKSWNTTTHIYSEIPENTLYPILSHSNPTYPVILKPSTKYSIVANSYSNGHTNSTINFNLGGATASTTVSNRVTTITTPSTLSNELLTMSGRGNKLNNVMVIEGDVVGDEPYFEGMCDSKSPILSNVGKNLLPTELSRSFKHITGNQVVSSIDLTSFLNRGVQYVIKLAIPKNVKIAKHYSSNSADTESVLVSHGVINSNNTIARFTIPSNSSSYYLFVNESGQSPSDYISDISELVTIELDTGNNPTEIKPYKSNTTTFNQKDGKTIVLRSLPDGICDTLNVETREYTRKIGEIIIDGSEDWKLSTRFSSTYNSYYFVLNETFRKNIKYVNDKYQSLLSGEDLGKNIGLYMGNSDNNIAPFISSDKMTLSEFKEYLQQNPVTVQYELATPIVSTIDVQGFPYAYKDGHVQLSSSSIEQSLTPKVEYSVVTNRNGQIRSNQKMVERHQKQLDRLQAMILTNLVNTQYEQTLTNLKYDLKNVREEVK